MKIGFDRARPEIVPHFETVYTLSFPSSHTMMSAIAYLTIGALVAWAQTSRRMKVFVLAVCLMLNLLVGISRIYLGVHWPTDVLAGWTAGLAWALATWLIAERVQ